MICSHTQLLLVQRKVSELGWLLCILTSYWFLIVQRTSARTAYWKLHIDLEHTETSYNLQTYTYDQCRNLVGIFSRSKLQSYKPTYTWHFSTMMHDRRNHGWKKKKKYKPVYFFIDKLILTLHNYERTLMMPRWGGTVWVLAGHWYKFSHVPFF